jgi:hypothetical protein
VVIGSNCGELIAGERKSVNDKEKQISHRLEHNVAVFRQSRYLE